MDINEIRQKFHSLNLEKEANSRPATEINNELKALQLLCPHTYAVAVHQGGQNRLLCSHCGKDDF